MKIEDVIPSNAGSDTGSLGGNRGDKEDGKKRHHYDENFEPKIKKNKKKTLAQGKFGANVMLMAITMEFCALATTRDVAQR